MHKKLLEKILYELKLNTAQTGLANNLKSYELGIITVEELGRNAAEWMEHENA